MSSLKKWHLFEYWVSKHFCFAVELLYVSFVADKWDMVHKAANSCNYDLKSSTCDTDLILN
jgi:predicted subunit of tRNA(5-methylaminomethyl-2-thiouridylate) methyltransferase